MKKHLTVAAIFLSLSLVTAPVLAKDPQTSRKPVAPGVDPGGEWENLIYFELNERKQLFWVGGGMCCVARDIHYTVSNVRPRPGEPGYPWGFVRLTSVSDVSVGPVPEYACRTREEPSPGLGIRLLQHIFNTIPPLLSQVTEAEVEAACGLRPHIGLPWTGGE